MTNQEERCQVTREITRLTKMNELYKDDDLGKFVEKELTRLYARKVDLITENEKAKIEEKRKQAKKNTDSSD